MRRLVLGVLLVAVSSPLIAQSPSFDVASIKRTPEGQADVDFAATSGGRLQARNNPVLNLITNAYGVPYYTVVGGPGWMRESGDRYDIEAKADREPSHAEMMQMLQTLLAERFHLRVHRETRELSAYVLTVARGGAKLTPSKEGDCVDRSSPEKRNALPSTEKRPGCGNNSLSSRGATPPNMRWTAVRIDMSGVTGALATFFRRPVVDQSGITGFFDIRLDLPPLQPTTRDDPGVSVFTVLQEQLGLRVEEGKGPVEVLVIDHIERPTPD